MKLWPSEKKKLQKLIFVLIIVLLINFLLLISVFSRFKKLAQSPPYTTVSNFPFEAKAPACLQRVDQSGWSLKNGQIRVFPHCLTVMNSRLGSRFNLDWYSSGQKATSGLLGTLEDHNAYLTLTLKDNEKTESVFPLLANTSFSIQSIDLGPTYQKINFENQDFLIVLTITSPFSPSRSPKDENAKISMAPFFYLDLSLSNKTPLRQTKTLRLSLGGGREIQTKNDLNLILLEDQVRKDGQKALATQVGPKGPIPFVEKQQGGFDWAVELEPGNSASTTLIYAGFLAGPVITDSSQEKKSLFKFGYTQWFDNVQEVVKFAVDREKEIRNKTERFEKDLEVTAIRKGPSFRWLLAQAFHSYLGNTWLVCDQENKKNLAFYVWEGEFKYLNTLDVAHDYGVLPGLYFPWALKLELESWQKSAKKDEIGTVIPHDLGKRFKFKNFQAYGIEGWQTSGMPVEENANFILLAYWYWHQTKDQDFIKELLPLIKELIASLIQRDNNGNGIADQALGMTTYDNDGNSALKEAPDSTYLGIKQLSAYLCAEEIFKSLKDESGQALVSKQAALITNSLEKASQKFGFIPLSLDPDFKEKSQFNHRTICGTEEQGFAFIIGLFYPALTDLDSGSLKKILPLLADSYQQAYEKSLVKNQEEQIIGLKLAEYQELALGWLSHSTMADYIAQKLFGQEYHSEEIFFPLLYDNPASFADGQYFKKPFYPPQTSLIFYPRGAALFGHLSQ